MCKQAKAGAGTGRRELALKDQLLLFLSAKVTLRMLLGAFRTTVQCHCLSMVCPDMFCLADCTRRGTCVFNSREDNAGKEWPSFLL